MKLFFNILPAVEIGSLVSSEISLQLSPAMLRHNLVSKSF